MPWIKLRQFSWTTRPGSDGYPEVESIKEVADPAQLPVDLSDLILTNALATTVTRPVLYAATLHELRLLGSYLFQARGQQLRVREKPFGASARHIRGFVSESVGLGMLTAAVQAAYRWYSRGHVHNLDALPTALAATYRRPGARPDLLFDTPAMRLAGEARGRSTRKPPLSPSQEQRNRLNALLPWAVFHGHKLVMTWAYLTGGGITVDWFTEDGGLPGLRDPLGVFLPPEPDPSQPDVDGSPATVDRSATQASEAPPDFSEERSDDDGQSDIPSDAPPERDRRFDDTSPSALLEGARSRTLQIEQRLFATAPARPAPIRVAGRPMRGEWVSLDLVGSPVGSLLVALLDEPLSPEASGQATDSLRQRIQQRTQTYALGDEIEELPPDSPVNVTVRGRFLVAVAAEGFAERWDLLSD